MVSEACLPSNAYYLRTPDYTLYSGAHVRWSEHSDLSFVYGLMGFNYGLGLSKSAYSNICRTVQTKLRDMQDSWLSKKADEIQSFADRKDMKKFFNALKTIFGPHSSGTSPLLSADGTSVLTDKEAILKRWAEHFDGVLNRPSSVNDEK